MIAYHCDFNTILQAPFVNREDKHRIIAYNSIMKKLTDRGHHVDIQILEIVRQLKKTQGIHIWDHPISKLYTDDCGRFPIRSRSGNEYIMIAYHCDFNTILQAPFVNRKEKHRIRAYNSIMKKLTDRVTRVVKIGRASGRERV